MLHLSLHKGGRSGENKRVREQACSTREEHDLGTQLTKAKCGVDMEKAQGGSMGLGQAFQVKSS